VELAAQVVASFKNLCQGVHIMAIGLEAEVPQILELAGLRARTARQAAIA
jgi:5,10-methylenetetrahydrofolate reductase